MISVVKKYDELCDTSWPASPLSPPHAAGLTPPLSFASWWSSFSLSTLPSSPTQLAPTSMPSTMAGVILRYTPASKAVVGRNVLRIKLVVHSSPRMLQASGESRSK